jgi:hypothetical protein
MAVHPDKKQAKVGMDACVSRVTGNLSRQVECGGFELGTGTRKGIQTMVPA